MEARIKQEERRYVLFRLGREEFGLPIEKVDSVIAFIEPTPVPGAPDVVEGVVNLRGRVIPVVDLRRRFQVPVDENANAPRILVAESASGPVGLVIDAANEVAEIDLEDVRPAPDAVLTPETAEAFEGVVSRRDRLVILIDLDRALPPVASAIAQDTLQPSQEGE